MSKSLSSRTTHCEVCGRQITVGPSGTEYGHRRAHDRPEIERCPRRPDCVDPGRNTPDIGQQDTDLSPDVVSTTGQGRRRDQEGPS